MFDRDFLGSLFGNMASRRGFGGESQRGRRFERGDLKYVILDLIKAKPAHGYEIIRALEERFHGAYAPSPGVVYPTLQYLEDLNYVTATERDGKRIFAITEEGDKFLSVNREVVDGIWGRVRPEQGSERTADPREMFGEMQQEIRQLAQKFGVRMSAGRVDGDKWQRIRAVIRRSIREIEDILEERPS